MLTNTPITRMQLDPIADMPNLKFIVGAKLILSDDGAEHVDTILPEGKVPEGQCRLRVFQEHDKELDSPRFFVLATQPADEEARRGASVSDAIECVAGMACLFFSIPPHNLVLVEQYEHDTDPEKDEFYFSHLPWHGDHFGTVLREKTTLDEVEELMGGELF